jgi:hypothetical protein
LNFKCIDAIYNIFITFFLKIKNININKIKEKIKKSIINFF